ncbi:MAG TPA: SUMF1/EgtB/PvdO family nonheme iron enzyme, partial [Pyrinomonadaceae bacterium]|nr:SUMF1/EgtB/PvdO family nonheme iron enzyme [Pyrinomonadaceae bacterium]
MILYQMLTGRLPYPQTDDAALIGALLTREPEPPPDDLPPALREVLHRALQKNPSARYQSVAEMRVALSDAIHSRAPQPPAPPANAESEQPTRKFTAPPAETVIAAPPTVPSPAVKTSDAARQAHAPQITPPQETIAYVPVLEDSSLPFKAGVPAKRRGLLWLGVAAFVIVGLVIAASMGLFSGGGNTTSNQPGTNRGTSSSAAMPPLKSYQFDTVKVDAKGKVTQRSKGQAQAYSEDLGNGVQLEMVKIPAGTFTMGSPASEAGRKDNEGPQHQVSVPEFYVGKYEVTQAQWRAVASLPKVK